MNEITATIKARRSYRKFKPEPVKEDELQEIINAGLNAPSGGNFQSCHFTVLYDRNIINQINREIYKTYSSSDNPFLINISQKEDTDYFYGAPTVVVLSANSNALTPQDDMAVASQNIMLAAESIDVAACWISFGGALSSPENNARFSKLLELPENHIPHHAMALGYRDGEKIAPLQIKKGRVNIIK